MVFQTFDRMIFDTLTFPGTRWYVLKIRHPQMVRDQKKFRNHWLTQREFCVSTVFDEDSSLRGTIVFKCHVFLQVYRFHSSIYFTLKGMRLYLI